MAGKRGKGVIYTGFVFPNVPDSAPKSHIQAVIDLLKLKVKSNADTIPFYETMGDKKAVKLANTRIKAVQDAITYFEKRLKEAKE